MNNKTVKGVMFSQWSPEEHGCLSARVVMWRQETCRDPRKRFATHIETREDVTTAINDGVVHFSFILGHYDMDLDEAKQDFDRRCRQLGVKFSHVNADYLTPTLVELS